MNRKQALRAYMYFMDWAWWYIGVAAMGPRNLQFAKKLLAQHTDRIND